MRSHSAPEHNAANALHSMSPPGATWSSVNLAEAVPGVMTPLCASVWVPASELGLREPFVAMGALPVDRGGYPGRPRRTHHQRLLRPDGGACRLLM